MLDDKTKDVDARVELLEQRKKINSYFFLIFYIIGLIFVFFSSLILSYKWDEIGIGIGITFLIVGSYFLVNCNTYKVLILLKKDKEVKREL